MGNIFHYAADYLKNPDESAPHSLVFWTMCLYFATRNDN